MKWLSALFALAAALVPADALAAECDRWVASLVSAQGSVQVRRTGDAQWLDSAFGDRYCPGDAIRLLERSRAAVLLRNDAVLRLDQNTTLTFSDTQEEPTTWIELLKGAIHFISRVPRSLRVLTPFVNGFTEGTEFWLEARLDESLLVVFDGRVLAENPAGSLVVASGQAAVARAGQAPVPFAIVRPRDAVAWTLYYPSVTDVRPEAFPDLAGQSWPAAVRRSIEASRRGDIAGAFAALDPVPGDVADARFYTYRAALLLSVGRVDEARADLQRALALEPTNGLALALEADIAVAQNEKDQALRLARQAVQSSPNSSAAWIALSYAQQARFDLSGALQSLQQAVRVDPEDAMAWARLAEIRLSFGQLGGALDAAKQAARLNPDLARTQTVLGFAYLSQIRTGDAMAAFERAIRLDQADPLPRLGLGLAKIRRGHLDAGRRELEIAAGLDPNNSLVRSYLGKAYYEERRGQLAGRAFERAKELDPNDPTPWFYDAILKQSENRPVEALEDLERAIDLNESRRVYRSRLLLDEDLAARGASLARIYDDLGFQQRALIEGTSAVNTDPSSSAAHRFLADSYATLPRHEIAQVSERLQAQLLNPLAFNPIAPSGTIARPFILSGAGPTDPGFNEFGTLFDRDRASLLASGVAGQKDTFGDEVAVSALYRRLFLSAGQFHYETQGFRSNDDLNRNVYDLFGQARLTPATSVQAEFRYDDFERGDIGLRFDPNNFVPGLRQADLVRSGRLSLRQEVAPGSEVLASGAYQSADFGVTTSLTRVTFDTNAYSGELQYLLRTRPVRIVTGAARYHADEQLEVSIPIFSVNTVTDTRPRYWSLYLYSLISPVEAVRITAGVSGDLLKSPVRDRDQVNPKAGLQWSPFRGTTIRGAVFRTLGRPFLQFETLEPTQVSGFNQFFDEATGAEVWRYGVGVDQRISSRFFVGGELSKRILKVPLLDPATNTATRLDWSERLARAYVYWAPASWAALIAEYEFERLEREENPSEPFLNSRTHRVPVGASIFAPGGLFARIRATPVIQSGVFADGSGGFSHGESRFWVADASLGYRLPRRLGIISAEGRNLLDKHFNYQDTDPANPRIVPARLILFRATVAY